MSRVSLLLAAISIALTGCPRPIRLDIDVPQARTASVTARLTKGSKPPVPDTCDLPCGVAIAPSTGAELTVKAPGFYPAVMSVEYEQMMPVASRRAVRLVVPLIERPKPASPPASVPVVTEPGGAAVPDETP